MPFAATPRLDHFGGHDVDQQFGKRAALGVAVEVIRRIVPGKVRINRHRQEQVVAVVDDDDLPDRAFLRRVVDEILLRAMGPNVALQRELAGDDLLDRDLLVPAVAAVPFFAARLRDFLGAAQGATFLVADRLPRHMFNLNSTTMPRLALAIAASLLVSVTLDGQSALHLPALDRALPPRAETIYRQLSQRVDARV